MAVTKITYGTSTAFTITLASLATGSARESTAIDNTTNLYLDALVYVKAKLQAGAPATSAYIAVYAYASEDGTNYTDNATGTNAALTMRTPTNLKLIGLIVTPTANGATWKSNPMSVAAAFGGILPRKWGIVVENQSGFAISATEGDNAYSYTGITLTTV